MSLLSDPTKLANAFPALKSFPCTLKQARDLAPQEIETYKEIHEKCASVDDPEVLTDLMIDSLKWCHTVRGHHEKVIAILSTFLNLPQVCDDKDFINLAKSDGISPLFAAVKERQLHVVLALVQCGGADVNWQVDNRCALMYATSANMVKLLVGLGANVNCFAGATTPLHWCLSNSNTAWFSFGALSALLVANADFSAKDENGRSPFRVALNAGNDAVIAFLIRRLFLPMEDAKLVVATCACIDACADLRDAPSDDYQRHDFEMALSRGRFSAIDLNDEDMWQLVEILLCMRKEDGKWPSLTRNHQWPTYSPTAHTETPKAQKVVRIQIIKQSDGSFLGAVVERTSDIWCCSRASASRDWLEKQLLDFCRLSNYHVVDAHKK